MKGKEIETELSILERFEAEEAKIRRESGELDREMRAKIRGKEKEFEAARVARVNGEADLAQAKAGYFDKLAQAESEEEARERAEAAGRTQKDLYAGRISSQFYSEKGVSDNVIIKNARASANRRLLGLVSKIRERASKIGDLEIEERTLEMDILFLKCFPAQNEIARSKALVKKLEAGIGEALCGQPAAHARLEHLKTIKGGRMTDNHLYNLDESGVKALLFDPILPSKYIENLEEFILKISGRGKIYQIWWADRFKDLSFMEE